MPEGITTGYNIVMYWADENGILADYTALARFKVTANTTTFTFGKNVVVPKGATKLLVYSQASGATELSSEFVTIDLPSNSSLENLGTPNTSFFVISDIHIGRSETSSINFKKMLNEAIRLNPNGMPIYIVGDMADHGSQSELDTLMSLYNEVLEENGKTASDYPMYAAIGNHDYPLANSGFLNFVTLPDGSHPTDTTYDFWLDGYHYVFLGSDSPSGLGAWFSDETMAWLDEKLAENRDPSRPTFVFLHQSLYNTVSGSLPGEGWHGVSSENDEELRAIFSKYPEIMFFNGHSHWTMDSVSNMYEATEELPINAFNCASVSYLWSGYNSVSGENLEGSQGYYVQIYGNQIFVRGRDFVNSQWVSSAQYLVELAETCEHDYEIDSVAYANGFGKDGTITYVCALCSLEKEETCAPIVYSKGYSADIEGFGITAGYSINYDEKTLYESANGVKINVGFIVANPDRLTGETFFLNGVVSASGVTVQTEITGKTYRTIDVVVKNIKDTQLDMDLVISAYINEISNEDSSVVKYTQFVQSTEKGVLNAYEKADGVLYSVSYNSVAKEGE